jgi:Asp-tRNA(Asn)/Glu-tRNA(Gln) amidotransferase B subunit
MEVTMTDMFDVDDDALQSIATLANKQRKLELEIKQQEEALKELKQDLKQVSETDIPEMLAEIGLSEFKLKDGTKVSVNQFYSASIPKDRYDEAMQWLRDNNHGDLIKNTISVDFGKGEDEAASQLKEHLAADGTSYTDKTGVHAMTLKAFVREQTEQGKNLPLDLLGVYIGQKTVIKEG